MTDKKTVDFENKFVLLTLFVCITKLIEKALGLNLAYPYSVQKFWHFRLIMFNTGTA
jgi:hypothetical protein